jgi:hypothetical protein
MLGEWVFETNLKFRNLEVNHMIKKINAKRGKKAIAPNGNHHTTSVIGGMAFKWTDQA